MEMQVKRQLIHILQNRVKFKWMSWDLQAINVNDKAQAELYVPQLENLAKGVSNFAYNYGVYVNFGTEPLYSDDTNFMSHYNAMVTSFSTIPHGYSLKNSPFNRYASEIISDIEGGLNVKIVRQKGSTIGNFYVGTNPIFKQNISGLTNSRASFLIRLVTNLFLHVDKFRLKDPNGNIIEDNMSRNDIAWFFFSGYTFTENGSYYDIRCMTFNPPQLVHGPSAIIPTAEDINNYHAQSSFDIIE